MSEYEGHSIRDRKYLDANGITRTIKICVLCGAMDKQLQDFRGCHDFHLHCDLIKSLTSEE